MVIFIYDTYAYICCPGAASTSGEQDVGENAVSNKDLPAPSYGVIRGSWQVIL